MKATVIFHSPPLTIRGLETRAVFSRVLEAYRTTAVGCAGGRFRLHDAFARFVQSLHRFLHRRNAVRSRRPLVQLHPVRHQRGADRCL
jgi:hypothetical protein